VLQRLALGLAREQVQLDEHLDLRAQDLGHDRRADVVDGAERVAALEVHVVVEVGRDEDDRRVRRLPPVSDQLRGLESVEAGHVHVEQDHREFLRQDPLQCLLARGCRDDVLPELLEHQPQREELVRAVVDNQDAGAVAGGSDRRRRAIGRHRDSHARSTPTMSSVDGLRQKSQAPASMHFGGRLHRLAFTAMIKHARRVACGSHGSCRSRPSPAS
jgi:hypothetical protein